MIPHWVLKRNPERYPVKFLAHVWQQRYKQNFGVEVAFGDEDYGELTTLRKSLGNLTQHVVEWMLSPVNWWHFCQQVRADSGLHNLPPYPHVGFLLKHRTRGLKLMRLALRNSTAPADVAFCTKLDELRYQRLKALVLVYAEGKPEQLAKIEKATTLDDLHRVFIGLLDGSTAAAQKLTIS